MKKAGLIAMSLGLSLVSVLAGCTKDEPAASSSPAATQTAKATTEPTVEPKATPKELSGELKVWSWFEWQKKEFEERHPKVTMNFNVQGFGEHHEKLQAVLAAGTDVPDVVLINPDFFGIYNNIPGLDDLQKPPYNVGQYKKDILPGQWERMLSLDGKRVWGFNLEMPPAVTFYRADLFEAAGLPSDPKELADHFKSWDNVIKAAETLKGKNQYLFTHANSPVGMFVDGNSPFNRELKFQWNNDNMVNLIEISKKLKQRGLASGVNIWEKEGDQAFAAGKTAAVHIGIWYTGDLQKEEKGGKDLAGKWRFTALPGGLGATSGGTFYAIPAGAKNKEAAWEYIKMVGGLDQKWYEDGWAKNPNWTAVPSYTQAFKWNNIKTSSPFFGGQDTRSTVADILTTMPGWTRTPIDNKAKDIFWKHVNEAIDKNTDAKAALQNAEDEINRTLAKDLEDLKNKMK